MAKGCDAHVYYMMGLSDTIIASVVSADEELAVLRHDSVSSEEWCMDYFAHQSHG